MTTPIRQQFRPEDFASPEDAASKIDYSFQQVRTQLSALNRRQLVVLDFVYDSSAWPMLIPQVRLDKVAGFVVLSAGDCGTVAAPVSPPTPTVVGIAWDKVAQEGRPAYRLTAASGLTAAHRYLITLEAVGG